MEYRTTRSRYLGDAHNRQVHDLDNQKADCAIGQILISVSFHELESAHEAGYRDCGCCLGPHRRDPDRSGV